MIAVDTNILVYAHRRDSPFHDAAMRAVRALAEGRAPWAIPWPCVHEFVAIATHPRVYDPPSTTDEALTQVEAWLDSPSLALLGENSTYWQTFRDTTTHAGVSGPRVHDARVASICLASGVRQLWTADRDFSRYPISTVNPLI